jgi:hypothetical protein
MADDRRHAAWQEQLRSAWEERVSRACLVLGVVSLWLALTLTDPRFLVLLVLALAGLWQRRAARAAAVARDAEIDDWG